MGQTESMVLSNRQYELYLPRLYTRIALILHIYVIMHGVSYIGCTYVIYIYMCECVSVSVSDNASTNGDQTG